MDRVAERVARLDHEQLVVVVGHNRLGVELIRMEGIAVAVRQEEMLAGMGEFLRRRVRRCPVKRISALKGSTSWRRHR